MLVFFRPQVSVDNDLKIGFPEIVFKAGFWFKKRKTVAFHVESMDDAVFFRNDMHIPIFIPQSFKIRFF